MGAHMGKDPAPGAGTPNVRACCYVVDSARNPAGRLAYTEQIAVTTPMSFGGDGTTYLMDIVEATQAYAPLDTRFPIWAGERYALGLISTSYPLRHGMAAVINLINPDNTSFYYRTGQSIPPDPLGYTSSSNEGWMTVWLEYVTNRSPVATATGPTGSTISLTPVLTGSFSDPDRTAGYGDRLERFQFRVRRKSDLFSMWSPGSVDASSSQQTSSTFSQTYAGSTLVAGIEYQVSCRVTDFFGTWSDWSAWIDFTPGANPIVTAVGGPNGKQETDSPSQFQLRYFHPAGLSSNAVQMRLRQNSQVILTTPIIAKTIASSPDPGTLSSITWAETGFSPLARGGVYTFEIRARGTDNLWGEYSNTREFSINAVPRQPTGLTPTNNSPVTQLPKVEFLMTDDDDTVATGLTATLEFTRPNLSIVTVAATYNAVTLRWEFQTTATELSDFGTYTMRAKGNDGTYDSPWSTTSTFQYLAGIAVTVTNPTNGLDLITTIPILTWTISAGTQVDKQIQIYDATSFPGVGNDPTFLPIYDTGTIGGTSGAVMNHQPPPGYIVDGGEYYLVITAHNNLGQIGVSVPIYFTATIPDPTPIFDFAATPNYEEFDVEPSGMLLTWEPTDYPPGDFIRYTITRRRLSGPIDPDGVITLVHIKSPSRHRFIDRTCRSGITYRWRITQTIRDVDDIKQSISIPADNGITLTTTVVHCLKDITIRAVGIYWASRAVDHNIDVDTQLPWNATKPTVVLGRQTDQTVRMTVRMIDDDFHTARSQLEAWRNVYEARQMVCFRDPVGRKVFGFMKKLTETDERGGIKAVDIEIQEVAHTEGVSS